MPPTPGPLAPWPYGPHSGRAAGGRPLAVRDVLSAPRAAGITAAADPGPGDSGRRVAAGAARAAHLAVPLAAAAARGGASSATAGGGTGAGSGLRFQVGCQRCACFYRDMGVECGRAGGGRGQPSTGACPPSPRVHLPACSHVRAYTLIARLALQPHNRPLPRPLPPALPPPARHAPTPQGGGVRQPQPRAARARVPLVRRGAR